MTRGRPAIGKFTAVRLSAETLARIDALVPAGKRADFIREAVARMLDQREAEAASSDAAASLLADPGALYAALAARSARPKT